MDNSSFFKRLAAETPAAEKRIQVISLILSGVVSYLFKFNFLPQNVLWAGAGLFAGIALLAQFATKDTGYMENAVKDPSSLLTALPDILSQVAEIKAAVSPKTAPDMASVLAQIARLSDTPPAVSSGPDAPAPVADAVPADPAAAEPNIRNEIIEQNKQIL